MKSQFSSFRRTRLTLLPVLFGTAAMLASAADASAAELRVGPRANGANGAATDSASPTTGELTLTAGKGTLIRLGEDAASVFVADPTVADVHVPSPRAIYVLGKKAGTTTLYALSASNKQLLQRTVVVSQDLDALRAMAKARFPNMNLQLNAGPGSLQIAGLAPSPADADAVVQMITPYLADKQVLINRMTIDKPVQVQLRVRITEVDRNITQQWGINWQSFSNFAGHFVGGIYSGRAIYNLTSSPATVNLPTNNAYSLFGGFTTGNTNIQAMIDALNQEGLMTVLAEPILVAMSGQSASFLAGGEFPIPISQVNGAISVDYKQFGVKLDFTPTVLSDRRISLKVRPEVSQIDANASITAGGLSIPGLSVRRADTTVELASGQSFAIGGLLQSNTTDIVSQVPGLGSIPILGKLFSSTNYQNNKTELVIIVTPYIVEPTDPGKLRTPLESLTSPSGDVEYGFQHQPHADASNTAGQPRLVGAAGYVY